MRVQVTLSEKMVSRVDSMAEEMGLSRSAVCNMLIGQGVANWEKANQMVSIMPQELADKLMKMKIDK